MSSKMLGHIYTKKSKNSAQLEEDSLAAVDKSDSNGLKLKVIALNVLLKTLSVDNAIDILMIADTCHADQLKSHVLRFIVSKAAEVLNSEGWKKMQSSKSQLTVEAMLAIAASIDPRNIIMAK
ncbi:speckle-type POZ protein-like [Planococcus citri]|uniref:speckle-type POZ protein-like n=1 Tax=Planococcus citri TaxID=170843 RepID=UPI0031F8B326